ncbi:DNA damage-inducible protein DinB [Polaribacter pacificus]|uniref:DNA damage-inducible protein DinB n=1 Tax=Polaribacter pacificus TaxID=1775173 RepID=A0A917M9N8_9FLAO|nr:DinB family protein [Polaribacter pacificus]GGG88084.1 DNA damage-inducible protein DinB [Polaribacter pacificus]
MIKADLKPTEFHEYYNNYVGLLANDTELIEGYVKGKKMIQDFILSIPDDKLLHRYQPEKWSILEVFQHLIDTERVFMYRCFRIARNDKTNLAGFDQDDYIIPSEADLKSKAQMLEEFTINRDNSISLLKSISEKNFAFMGSANGSPVSARAAAFIILGHDIWHTKIIQERYL